ncbi:hypothetical protein HMPREF1624_05574 [Sporothrix schenckii ATCC 58251]|uniref:F-box domain-containing protein n=1 Tax=Sporothrix schenckii (strain ATCC 58251 / de Perez 2211183) TaxID=1391915 RepID=U7PPB7_SPOS1|nr:hypothetical protein HMPREF1624_05574 [Sporothrix schenckii ATCC 58251]
MADQDETDAATVDRDSVEGTVSLMCLPNELLLAVSNLLEIGDLSRLARASRFCHRLLVDTLYQRDAAQRAFDENSCSCCSRALRWGCLTSSVGTLRRALAAPGADLSRSWPHAFAMALDTTCPSPLTTLDCLLNHGASASVPVFRGLHGKPIDGGPSSSRNTFWPLLADILDAAALPPRWCPVPVVACFLAHGATLALGSEYGQNGVAGLSHIVSATWSHVLGLVQVRGPRRWTWSHADSPELRHDHCLHDAVPCNVALTRLLLQQGHADPNMAFGDRHPDRRGDNATGSPTDSLLLRAIADPRRPVELLQCLTDAGADLKRLCYLHGSEKDSERQSRDRPPLHAILEDAVRLRSLAAYPRRQHWDCYPRHVWYPKAEAILRFLLARGLPLGGNRFQRESRRGGREGRAIARTM